MEKTEDKKPQNPSAFPLTYVNPQYSGMTLRDYFAAKAMQAIVSAKLVNGGKDFVIGETGKSNQSVVRAAYGISDAMLKERQK